MRQKSADSELLQRALHSCRVCAEQPVCLAWDLSDTDLSRLNEIIEKPPLVEAGRRLFDVDDQMQALYAVRTGAFKVSRADGDGGEQIFGFALPGELVGLDGIYSRRHRYAGVALQQSAVCLLPYTQLAQLMGSTASVRHKIMQLANRYFDDNGATDHGLRAEQRLARFLLDLSGRNHTNGGSHMAFDLPMSRADIANYLNLPVDEIDQSLDRLTAAKLVALESQGMRVLDTAGLAGLSNGEA